MATRADNRLHFDLAMSEATNNAIQTIAAARNLTPAEILSRAVALFVEVEKNRKAGQTLGVLDADKKPVVEFTGF